MFLTAVAKQKNAKKFAQTTIKKSKSLSISRLSYKKAYRKTPATVKLQAFLNFIIVRDCISYLLNTKKAHFADRRKPFTAQFCKANDRRGFMQFSAN